MVYPLPPSQWCTPPLLFTVVLTVYIILDDDAIAKDLGVETDQARWAVAIEHRLSPPPSTLPSPADPPPSDSSSSLRKEPRRFRRSLRTRPPHSRDDALCWQGAQLAVAVAAASDAATHAAPLAGRAQAKQRAALKTSTLQSCAPPLPLEDVMP